MKGFVLINVVIGLLCLTSLAASPPLGSRPGEPGADPSDRDATRNIIHVGPKRQYTLPSQAAKIAKDGQIIEIDAGTYRADVAVWRQNHLTLRGVGGRVRLVADGAAAQGKAIWVIKGNDTRVENIEFTGASVPDNNGAGIRHEGVGLTVIDSYFHHNENGILTGNRGEGDVVIERCEFSSNGYGDGKSHNIYIGKIHSFTLRNSYVHHAVAGHNVKTRASTNHILYNRIMDEASGTASYAIDLPNGGNAFIIGNLLQQGPKAVNGTMVNYASQPEHKRFEGRLYIVNNTFVNERDKGVFLRNRSANPARLINNIFSGPGDLAQGPLDVAGNLVSTAPGLANVTAFDYSLRSDSPAVDAGVDPGLAEGQSLRPAFEYVHPVGAEPRASDGRIDIGAYEFTRP